MPEWVKIVGVWSDRVMAEELKKTKKASILLGRNTFNSNVVLILALPPIVTSSTFRTVMQERRNL